MGFDAEFEKGKQECFRAVVFVEGKKSGCKLTLITLI
jgi:hypothetical protein